jgi:hypothetical protein
MTYNRFFNIHIPKTGGTYFRENMLKPVEKHINDFGIKTDTNGNGGEGKFSDTQTFHWCWYKPYVEDNSYIFTSFRDPVKRVISHFAWQAARAVSYGLSDYSIEDINVDNFYKWLEQYFEVYKNFQSKNLVYYNKDHSIYKEAVHKGWKTNDVPRIESFLFDNDFATFKINKDNLYSNINKINLFVKDTDLIDMDNQTKIRNKILIDLNVPLINIPVTNLIYGNQNPLSNNLFNQLTKKQINELYEINKLDSEIFFTDSLFYKP